VANRVQSAEPTSLICVLAVSDAFPLTHWAVSGPGSRGSARIDCPNRRPGRDTMIRHLLGVMAIAAITVPAFAQGIRDPNPPAVPPPNAISPRMPYSWWNTPYYRSIGPSYGAYYIPWYGIIPVEKSRMFSQQPNTIPAPPPLVGAGSTSTPAINPHLVAEFNITFPTTVQMWVNGEKQEDSQANWTLSSPPLQQGEKHTFNVKAKWNENGKDYEWSRVVQLGSGERSKANVLQGFEVQPTSTRPPR
jgi:hypothetical protein